MAERKSAGNNDDENLFYLGWQSECVVKMMAIKTELYDSIESPARMRG